MSEATPRPWHYGVTEQGYFGEGLIGPQGETIFANTGRGMSDASEANAKLIVRAVNNHDALLDVAKAVREQFPLAGISSNLGSHNPLEDLLARAEAAIAAAEANA